MKTQELDKTIYCAAVVYSVPQPDGKKHLKQEIQHFADKADAIDFVNETENWCKRAGNSFKFGNVYSVEEVVVG